MRTKKQRPKIRREEVILIQAQLQGLCYQVRGTTEKQKVLIKLTKVLDSNASSKIKLKRCQHLCDKLISETKEDIRYYEKALAELARRIPRLDTKE